MSDSKKDDKKDEKKPESGGGLGGITGRLGGMFNRGGDSDKKPDNKKPTDKKDDKKPEESGGGLAGIASGLTGRLGGLLNRGGGDTADKKPADDPKKPVPPPGSSSAPPRPSGMGGSSPASSSSSSAPGSRPSGTGPLGSSSSSSSSAPGARPGGSPPPSSSAASSRPGGPTASSSTSAGAAKPKDDKAAAPAESGGGFLAGLRSKLPFGRGAETAVAASAAAGAAAKPGAAPSAPAKPGPGATSQTKQAAAKAQAEPEGSGGIWEWMTGKRRAPATEPQSRTLREGSTRLPQADTSGWNLDTKLDLIGIGLILGAVVLGLSALSAEQANVTGSINRFIGQLLGWGAFAVPMTMGGVGIFLLVTRFGDTPPELDMVRIAGVVLAYIGLLTLFQYIEVLGPRYQCDLDCFRIVVQRSYQDGRGGGIIGMNTHLFLVENIGEIGGFVFVMGLMLVAGMLITRTTATELMVLFVSLYRSFRVSWQHQSQRRAAQRQLAAARRAEAARITVSRPGGLEAGRVEVRQPALPMGAEPMVRVGGQVVTSASAAPSPASAQAGAGGAFRGLLNRLPGRKPDGAPAAAPSSPLVTQRSAENGSASFAPPVSQPAAAAAPAAMMPPPPPPAPPPAQVQPAAAQPVSAPTNPTAVEGPTVGVAPNLPITPPKAPPLVHSTVPRHDYNVPEFRQLLNPGSKADYDRKALVERARIIQETLESFGAPGKVVEINTGPVITQFGVEPGYVTQRDRQSRVKVSAIAQLDKDLQLSLGARSIRIEAPVPGKGYVGIEVPNDNPMTVSLRDVMEANRFQRIKSPLAIALGESVDGTPVAADLTSMPHLLIAGTTGSGKSVCVNAIIASLLLRNTPDQVKFIMVDPKRVELTGYNGIPHLIAPVVVDVERIIGVLKWLTREMDDRYKKFSVAGARNIDDYNRNRAADVEAMPYIVAIIDELADLMMLAPEEAERYITRVAAMARATGIHLVIATQRPSADVVTGLIKANFPARIAFAVAGNVDSRVILDQPGAEKLLGRGDMLYLSADSPSAQRLQGVFVSDSELNSIIRYWKAQAVDQPQKPAFNFGVESDEGNKPARPAQQSPYSRPTVGTQQQVMPPGLFDDIDEDDDDYEEEDGGGSEDDLFERAVELVRRQNGASVSLLQRKMRIGYARAARLIDAMEERGIVGPQKEGSSKQRDVLVPK